MTVWDSRAHGGRSLPAPVSPRRMDATVAFDDLLIERWHRSPCVLCQAPRPGHYGLWLERETGFMVILPLCPRCDRRPERAVAMAHALQDRLHPEAPGSTP